MTDEILLEIEKFFENNKKETQIYLDILKHLDVDSQFQVIDAIQYLITEEGLDTQEAVIQVFNNVFQEMRQI